MALDKMVENGGVVSRAMLDVGYDPNTAKTPQKLTESKGFKQLLAESGLTENLITKSLVEDIESKPKNRLGELRLGAEILGMKAEEPGGNKTLVIMVTGNTASRYGVRTNIISSDSSQ